MSSAQQVTFSSYTPRTAIVTGASQGIGYAIAHRLADDGFDLAINDIESKQERIDKVVNEFRQKDRRAIAVPGDVADETTVLSIVKKTANELGGVDVMVANAGIGLHAHLLETSIDKFDTVLRVNTRGVFLCFKYAAAQMVKQGRGGRLIAASSVAGRTGQAQTTAYCASKFAVRGIVQSAAADLRQYGITANAYCPGYIMTPLLQDDQEFLKAIDPSAIGQPEDVASIVSYFAKPESYFVNGQSLSADGGAVRFD